MHRFHCFCTVLQLVCGISRSQPLWGNGTTAEIDALREGSNQNPNPEPLEKKRRPNSQCVVCNSRETQVGHWRYRWHNDSAVKTIAYRSLKISEINQMELSRLSGTKYQVYITKSMEIDEATVKVDSIQSALFQRALYMASDKRLRNWFSHVKCVSFSLQRQDFDNIFRCLTGKMKFRVHFVRSGNHSEIQKTTSL